MATLNLYLEKVVSPLEPPTVELTLTAPEQLTLANAVKNKIITYAISQPVLLFKLKSWQEFWKQTAGRNYEYVFLPDPTFEDGALTTESMDFYEETTMDEIDLRLKDILFHSFKWPDKPEEHNPERPRSDRKPGVMNYDPTHDHKLVKALMQSKCEYLWLDYICCNGRLGKKFPLEPMVVLPFYSNTQIVDPLDVKYYFSEWCIYELVGGSLRNVEITAKILADEGNNPGPANENFVRAVDKLFYNAKSIIFIQRCVQKYSELFALEGSTESKDVFKQVLFVDRHLGGENGWGPDAEEELKWLHVNGDSGLLKKRLTPKPGQDQEIAKLRKQFTNHMLAVANLDFLADEYPDATMQIYFAQRLQYRALRAQCCEFLDHFDELPFVTEAAAYLSPERSEWISKVYDQLKTCANLFSAAETLELN